MRIQLPLAAGVLCFALLGTGISAAPLPEGAAAAQALGMEPAREAVRNHPGWRVPRVVLVAGDLHEDLPRLKDAIPQARFVELPTAHARDIAAADIVLGTCEHDVLAAAPHLVWVQWLAAGVERCVREPLLRERHLVLTNMQRTAAPSMAEHVIGMMLALARHFDYFYRAQQQAQWAEQTPRLEDLEGKTVLVVGLGGIGTEVARRAHALGMKVTATRASSRTGPDYVSYVGLADELPKLAASADFIVNCAPLTSQTTGIFNEAFFAGLKRGAFFVNVGRGRSAVTADLVSALRSGQLGGAALDVVDPEPLPADSPLWHLPNVIITPHISADTSETQAQRVLLLHENLRRYAAGEPLLAVVDIERGY
ncbi:MAG: D-2-hydroxyacid dehydrogenase [Gammaproteobacteria bacterium]|nr:D-2-hydroxyacid dehydrogenase [Gammaproteobacteria bacterium]